jgi:hypothetical protein
MTLSVALVDSGRCRQEAFSCSRDLSWIGVFGKVDVAEIGW